MASEAEPPPPGAADEDEEGPPGVSPRRPPETDAHAYAATYGAQAAADVYSYYHGYQAYGELSAG